jgi:hypothetical protein
VRLTSIEHNAVDWLGEVGTLPSPAVQSLSERPSFMLLESRQMYEGASTRVHRAGGIALLTPCEPDEVDGLASRLE